MSKTIPICINDAEGRRIAVGADHVETGICQRFLSDLEGVDGRVVLGNEASTKS